MISVPASWTQTLMGADPGFVDPTMDDLRPSPTSPLVTRGTSATAGHFGALAFPSPLALPAWNPPSAGP